MSLPTRAHSRPAVAVRLAPPRPEPRAFTLGPGPVRGDTVVLSGPGGPLAAWPGDTPLDAIGVELDRFQADDLFGPDWGPGDHLALWRGGRLVALVAHADGVCELIEAGYLFTPPPGGRDGVS